MQITLELESKRDGGAILSWHDDKLGEDVIWQIYPKGTFVRPTDWLRGNAGTFASLASDLLDVLRAIQRREETP